MQRVVGAGLVGHRIGTHPEGDQVRVDLGGIAEDPDGNGPLLPAGVHDQLQAVFEAVGLQVEIAGGQALVDALLPAFDGEKTRPGKLGGERLGPAHAAEAGGEDPPAGEIAAEVPAAHRHEGLVGPLDDALAADIDPRTGGHLAEHHQALAVEFVEVLPGRPVRHQVGVGDQHSRRRPVGAEDPDRLSRLDQQGLVVLHLLEGRDDLIEALPVAGRSADAAVDHQVLRALGHHRVEIVHQHAQRRFGLPAFRGKGGASRGRDDTWGHGRTS